jgi:hypothetical protein
LRTHELPGWKGERLVIRGPHSAESLALALRARKREIMALLSTSDMEVAWRAVTFRAAIPPDGPVWAPRILNTATCDPPGHCYLCGDELPRAPAPRFLRCAPCVQTLWTALNGTQANRSEGSSSPLAAPLPRQVRTNAATS